MAKVKKKLPSTGEAVKQLGPSHIVGGCIGKNNKWVTTQEIIWH